MNMHNEPQWKSAKQWPRNSLQAIQWDWLTDPGSLTQKLIKASNNNFRVNLLNQSWQQPKLSEQKCLNLPHKQRVIIREVELCCYGRVWVTARSIFPIQCMTKNRFLLTNLGNKSLGQLLFSHNKSTRTEFEIARINKTTWARRSVFYLNHSPLMVSEMFDFTGPLFA